MHRFADLVISNIHYAATFAEGDLRPSPTQGLAVLTCMDCRIDTMSVFGLDPGAAHVVRNAGARATDDALRSLILSTNKLGVRRIAVVHHTYCGVNTSMEDVRESVRTTSGADPSAIDFALYDDPEIALLEDLERIASCPFIPEGIPIGGFIYDVATGRITGMKVVDVVHAAETSQA